MSDIDVYLGARLREAREEAGLARADLAARLGRDADWVAGAEDGSVPLTARDLWLLAMVLRVSVSRFFPGVRDADLSDAERALLDLFRSLDASWQATVTESLRSQVDLMRESRAIDALPERERQQARYRAMARYLLDNGATVAMGPRGRPQFQGGDMSAILQGMPEAERSQLAEAAWALLRERREADDGPAGGGLLDADPDEPADDREDAP